MNRVLCIGSVSKDLFFPTDEGVIMETPEDLRSQEKVAFELGGKFLCTDRAEAIGGVAANVAQGIVRMGHSAGVYGRIGNDELGSSIRHDLDAAGVDTSLLEGDITCRTDLSSIIVIRQTGDRIIFHNRDAADGLSIDPKHLNGFEWFYISALNGQWKDNWHTLFRVARERGIHIVLNPGQHNLKEDARLILESLPHVSILFVNKDEALELLLSGGIEHDQERLKNEIVLTQLLHDFGPLVVAVTDGKRGAWVYDGQELWHGDVYEPHGLVDTTGAGDAFASGFFSAYLSHYPLERALRYGLVNGGSVVGSYGACRGLLDDETATSYFSHIKTTLLARRS